MATVTSQVSVSVSLAMQAPCAKLTWMCAHTRTLAVMVPYAPMLVLTGTAARVPLDSQALIVAQKWITACLFLV